MQLGFQFDQSRCIGCFTCVAACRSRHCLAPEDDEVLWVKAYEAGEYPHVTLVHTFLTCFHCEQPACVEACPEGIFSKRAEDGVVLLEGAERCSGCGLCAQSCPYSAPKLISGNQRRKGYSIVKCDLCIDRIQRNNVPVCVLACPVEAITVGVTDEFVAKKFVRSVEGYPDYHETFPSIFFVPEPHGKMK